MTARDAPASAAGVSAAAVSAQEHWVETEAERLTCLGQDDRELIAGQLRPAASRVGFDWTTRFAAKVFSFALWSGVVFASAIGVVLWSVKIPSRHAPAAVTAAAYFMIVVVAAPACRAQARPVLGNLSRISDTAAHRFLVVYLTILTAAAILYSIVNASAFDSAAIEHVTYLSYLHEFTAFVVVTVLGFVIAYLVLAYAYASALRGSGWGEPLPWAAALATTAITAWFPPVRSAPSQAGNHYLDSGLLRLLGCTAAIDNLGRGQHIAGPRAVKSVVLGLELAAADVEQYAVSRVPRRDVATRRLALREGTQLASAIRKAKAPVASALRPSDYTAAAAGLAAFLLALAQPVPDGSAPAAPANESAAWTPPWRRIAGRIWNAVLLAAGGVFLPLLPIYNSDHAAAAGLRYALLTAAVLALAAPASVSDVIQRNLENTLPSQAGHPAP